MVVIRRAVGRCGDVVVLREGLVGPGRGPVSVGRWGELGGGELYRQVGSCMVLVAFETVSLLRNNFAATGMIENGKVDLLECLRLGPVGQIRTQRD